MCTILPFRKQADHQPVPDTYAEGWRDGCSYGERLAKERGRIEGTLAGLLIAFVSLSLAFYFGMR